MSSLFELLNTANNGLKTQREVMQVSAQNIANMFTPGYKAQHAIVTARTGESSFDSMLSSMAAGEGGASMLSDSRGEGTMVARIEVDMKPGNKIYMPDHPLADANGNIEMSNVDSASEMLHMSEAVKQYKANLVIAEMAKKAATEALNMTKNS
jgi:flagellar basal-body rod protein FlgC